MKCAYVIVTYPPSNYLSDPGAYICAAIRTLVKPESERPDCDQCYVSRACFEPEPEEPKIRIVSNNGIQWTIRFLEQFYKMVGGELLVIDNSFSKHLKGILSKTKATVIRYDDYPGAHGSALDQAFNYLKAIGYNIAVILEPDTTITSTEWVKQLTDPIIKNGMWLVAGFEHDGHIIPSAYNLDINWPSFNCQPKYLDIKHPYYHIDASNNREWENWYKMVWDTGMKNRFYAASQHKFKLVNITGFEHHLNGRTKWPDSI